MNSHLVMGPVTAPPPRRALSKPLHLVLTRQRISALGDASVPGGTRLARSYVPSAQ